MSLVSPDESYEVFVRLGSEFSRMPKETSQEKIWGLFRSAVEDMPRTFDQPGRSIEHEVKLETATIAKIAEQLRVVVSQLLPAEKPKTRLSEAVTFSIQALEVMHDLEQQLRSSEQMSDPAIAGLKEDLASLSSKWLHYLVENPEGFTTVLQNPQTAPYAMEILQNQWESLSILMQSLGMEPYPSPWPPSDDPIQCFEAWQKLLPLALSRRKEGARAVDGFQRVVSWLETQRLVLPEQASAFQEQLTRCKDAFLSSEPLTKEQSQALGETVQVLQGVSNMVVARLEKGIGWLEESGSAPSKADQQMVQEAKNFLKSMSRLPGELSFSQAHAEKMQKLVAQLDGLKELCAQRYEKLRNELSYQLRELVSTDAVTEEERLSLHQQVSALPLTMKGEAQPLTEESTFKDVPWSVFEDHMRTLEELKTVYSQRYDQACRELQEHVDVIRQLRNLDGEEVQDLQRIERFLERNMSSRAGFGQISKFLQVARALRVGTIQDEIAGQARGIELLQNKGVDCSHIPPLSDQATMEDLVLRGKALREAGSAYLEGRRQEFRNYLRSVNLQHPALQEMLELFAKKEAVIMPAPRSLVQMEALVTSSGFVTEFGEREPLNVTISSFVQFLKDLDVFTMARSEPRYEGKSGSVVYRKLEALLNFLRSNPFWEMYGRKNDPTHLRTAITEFESQARGLCVELDQAVEGFELEKTQQTIRERIEASIKTCTDLTRFSEFEKISEILDPLVQIREDMCSEGKRTAEEVQRLDQLSLTICFSARVQALVEASTYCKSVRKKMGVVATLDVDRQVELLRENIGQVDPLVYGEVVGSYTEFFKNELQVLSQIDPVAFRFNALFSDLNRIEEQVRTFNITSHKFSDPIRALIAHMRSDLEAARSQEKTMDDVLVLEQALLNTKNLIEKQVLSAKKEALIEKTKKSLRDIERMMEYVPKNKKPDDTELVEERLRQITTMIEVSPEEMGYAALTSLERWAAWACIDAKIWAIQTLYPILDAEASVSDQDFILDVEQLLRGLYDAKAQARIDDDPFYLDQRVNALSNLFCRFFDEKELSPTERKRTLKMRSSMASLEFEILSSGVQLKELLDPLLQPLVQFRDTFESKKHSDNELVDLQAAWDQLALQIKERLTDLVASSRPTTPVGEEVEMESFLGTTVESVKEEWKRLKQEEKKVAKEPKNKEMAQKFKKDMAAFLERLCEDGAHVSELGAQFCKGNASELMGFLTEGVLGLRRSSEFKDVRDRAKSLLTKLNEIMVRYQKVEDFSDNPVDFSSVLPTGSPEASLESNQEEPKASQPQDVE